MINDNQQTHPLLNADNSQLPSGQMMGNILQFESKLMTENQLIEQVKPQLTKEYGEEIANKITSKYATGNVFEKSFYDQKVNAMREEAKNMLQEKKQHDTLESIYAKHNTNKAELTKALESCRDELWLESDPSFRNTLLGNPVFLTKALNDYKNAQNKTMDVHAGVTPFNTAPQQSLEDVKSKLVKLERKEMSSTPLSFEEEAERKMLKLELLKITPNPTRTK